MRKIAHAIRQYAKISQRLVLVILLFGFFSSSSAWAAEFTHVSVPENPYNSLAKQLLDKQSALNSREAALNALQAKLDQGYQQVMLVLAGLFMLIVLNFVLDYRRRKKSTINLFGQFGQGETKNGQQHI